MDNKRIISYCKNFYKIVNFKPLEGDNITTKLIDIYQEYIFKIDVNNSEDINTVIQIDEVLSKYIDDYSFRDELKKQIVNIKIKNDVKDVLKEIIKAIINIFNNYQEFTTRIIYISKWI